VLSVALVLVVTGCSGSGGSHEATPVTRVDRRLRTAEAHAVIEGDGKSQALPVFIVYPVGPGPFPLVVFSHGYGDVAEGYRPFLERLAREGYVVAGPDYPSRDFTTHPSDITRVIDDLTGSHSPLPGGVVDDRNIAVAGHSLGGTDAYGVSYNTCCRDPRITAVVTFEAPLLEFPGGEYLWRGPALLIVLGDDDPLVAADTGRGILDQFTGGNGYLLTVNGGGHGGGLSASDRGFTSVQPIVQQFLAAYLKHDPRAKHELKSTTTRRDTTLQRASGADTQDRAPARRAAHPATARPVLDPSRV